MNISADGPCRYVAEVGSTCQFKVDVAYKLADIVKQSGADAIKFQHIGADDLIADKRLEFAYQWGGGFDRENTYQMFKRMAFDEAQWRAITTYCDQIGLTWYLSADTLAGVELGEKINCPMYKVSAWDLRNYPLMRAMAQTKKPVQLDLGPAIAGEVFNALEALGQAGSGPVILVHGTHSKDPFDCNLRAIPYLKATFAVPVGWNSEYNLRGWDEHALCLGACLIEQRLTLDRTIHGHHHWQSLNPDDWTAWLERLRNTERILGPWGLRPSLADLQQKGLHFTSLHAARDIHEGEHFTEDCFCAKRPGGGISPYYTYAFLGKEATRDIPRDTYLQWDDA